LRGSSRAIPAAAGRGSDDFDFEFRCAHASFCRSCWQIAPHCR
jgi:hypothetical protein